MPAKLELCTCNKHGRIILESGYRGSEFCEQQHALHMVRMGIRWELLNDDEAKNLTEKILASPLPKTPDDVELSLLFNIEKANKLALDHDPESQAWRPDRIHRMLQRKVRENEIPADFLEVIKREIASSGPN